MHKGAGPIQLNRLSNLAQAGDSEYRSCMAKPADQELLNNLRGMVRDMLRLRCEGGAYAKLARAHGYVDGYMRVLLETGVADHKQLLALVAEERARFEGPATREVAPRAEHEDESEPRIVAA